MKSKRSISETSAVDAYAVFNSGFIQEIFTDEAGAEQYAAAELSGSPEVEIMKMRLVPAECVAPRPAVPTPEEFLLNVFPGANLDTLEINARLVAKWLGEKR